jgi:hypothetical protein
MNNKTKFISYRNNRHVLDEVIDSHLSKIGDPAGLCISGSGPNQSKFSDSDLIDKSFESLKEEFCSLIQ